ncbi:hypothetical protein HOP62_15160 [Halomonas sp. MCCC 1A17488]|uniref:hypothetical protein n=1 Tax=unclassified Halomonas TaxID=2609666 RepID=UPI0018D23E61|nr:MULTISPECIES: hypothetical protein [unclassified Halomonas]MCE8017415.1 hypothetical protein [Halomonas sp. MCCC 1A17488]MCG3240748.1 hypothetical protein [Halomonas sp. MCCC 1A17488]QPP49414.1 hypothetical protein I4484_19980 [Halomonas sp. SS10-MC5]
MTSSSLPDADKSRFPRLRLMMLATLVTLSVALWYLAAHLLRGESDVDWHYATLPCDLHRAACSAGLGEGRTLTLSIDAPAGIRALERLPLTVRVDGVEVEAASVDFVGRDMDMGLHRFPLSKQDKGRFEGVGQVPICTQSAMPWQAQVVVETPAGRLGSRFDFTVERSVP